MSETAKVFEPDEDGFYSFGHVLGFAESLGWKDPELDEKEDWSPNMADATEESARDFIENAGYKFRDDIGA